VSMLVNLTTRLCINLGFMLGDGLNALFRGGLHAVNHKRTPRAVIKAQQDEAVETSRIAGCRQAVLEFASAFGYMTREVMSPEELEAKIDSGSTGQELFDEFMRRVAKIPGIVLGQRPNGHSSFEIKLPFSLRDRHCYLIGRSGSGKTNLIRTMLLQDIYYDRGVGVLAPEQELITDELLPYIPEDRVDDVVYVNPADTKFPIAFNPLHCDPGEDKEQKVDDFVTIFKRAVGETGYRMDAILSETLYALINRPGSTLEDIPRFLSRENRTFRTEVLKSADERTRIFFEESYPSMDKNAAAPVITRINAFTRRESVRALLCQPGKSFNFRHAMDEGKILLFNLSDGVLGEQASQLLGQIIISKLQLAAMSRVDTPAALRRPFYLYLDEFQTFTGVAETSYEKILSRARKYKLGLVLAHQQTGQISQKLLKEIFGNVTTFISFSVSHEDAMKLSKEYAYDAGVEVQYIDPGEFIRLRTGEAIGKIGKTVFPLHTVLLPTEPHPEKVNSIINRSRKNYCNGATWEENTKHQPRPDTIQLPPPQKPPDDIDPQRVF
jgi:hypothetical protein